MSSSGGATAMAADPTTPIQPTNTSSVEEDVGQEILRSTTDDIYNRTRLLENEIKVKRMDRRKGCNHPEISLINNYTDLQK